VAEAQVRCCHRHGHGHSYIDSCVNSIK
jgi:hypothetical protein